MPHLAQYDLSAKAAAMDPAAAELVAGWSVSVFVAVAALSSSSCAGPGRDCHTCTVQNRERGEASIFVSTLSVQVCSDIPIPAA